MESRIKAAQNLSNRVRRNKKDWPVPVGYMGGGVHGRVFVTNNGRLMKIQKLNATKEFNILKRLIPTGIAPKVRNGNIVKLKIKSNNTNITRELGYGSKIINSLNMFIMNRVGSMTLKQYYKTFTPSNKYVHNYLSWLVHQLQMAGIEHGNLHRENIIVSVDSKGKITGMWLIDFGKSKYHSLVPSRNIESYMKTYKYPNMIKKVLTRNKTPSPLRRTKSVSSKRNKEIRQ
jgi:RIO-like serine/threonine protein kinase